jgi:short subunit dehydrogenase-like uncharacterized protein
MSRRFDVVVLGATGYTGKLVVEYLSKSSSGRFIKWAVAGRSEAKVKEFLATIGSSETPVVVADCTDGASLDKLCAATTVVIACAGPFALIGMPVVDACMRNKTHYVDITGEFQFVRQVIEKYHDQAVDQGTFIVPCCGFDSVPSDIGNFVAHKTAGQQLQEVRGFYKVKGSASGGTLASICTIFSTIQKKDLSPASLNPPGAKAGVPSVVRAGVKKETDLGAYSGPFLMAGTNERVVRRSNAFLGRPNVLYCEAVAGPFMYALVNTFALYLVGIFMGVPFLRFFVKKFLTPQGSGPSAASRSGGMSRTVFRATPASGSPFYVTFPIPMDPYDVTAVFVAESACSVLDILSNNAKSECGLRGGVLTPASAFGSVLLERLSKAGLKLDVTNTASMRSKSE